YAWSGRADEGELSEEQRNKQQQRQEQNMGALRFAQNDKPLIPSDYHDEMLGRLRRVEAALHERYACETKCYVDTGPLVERTAAAKAGVGWIGKNACVLNQGLGSWLLLGVIVTSLEVGQGEELQVAVDRCGSCTRCIDACPTHALVG